MTPLGPNSWLIACTAWTFALNLLRANGVTNVSEATDANALSLDRLLAYTVT